MARGLGLRHVEVIYAVMLTGTITGAAAKLSVSQPAISNCVKDAEDRLGFPLFTRQYGRIFPTERALAIFSEIERSFTGLEAINTLCCALREQQWDRLVISSTPAWATAVLPRVLHDYLSEYPQLRCSVITRSSEYVQSLVSSCKADIGFGLYSPPIPEVEQWEIAKAPLLCTLPKNHPLATRSRIHITDIAFERLITFSSVEGTDDLINEAFALYGIEPLSVVECPAALTVCAMIEAGVGIGLVHQISTHIFRDRNIVCLPFEPEISISMCAYWRTGHEPPYDRQRLLSLAQNYTHSLVQSDSAAVAGDAFY